MSQFNPFVTNNFNDLDNLWKEMDVYKQMFEKEMKFDLHRYE